MTIAIWKNFIFTGSYDGIINKWNLNLGSKNRALLLNAQSNLLNCFVFCVVKSHTINLHHNILEHVRTEKKCPKKFCNEFTHMSWLFSATIKKLLYGDPRSSLDNNVFIVKSVGTFFFLSVHAQVCCELCVYTPFLANQRYEKG